MKTFSLIFLLFAPLLSAQSNVLRNKQSVCISGVVETRGGPNKHFYVLKVQHTYTLAFSKEDGGVRMTQEISFAVPNELRDELTKHIGESVTVEGEMWLESVSPYYWNGNMVQTKSITLSNGRVLHPVKSEQLAKPRGDYTVTITIPVTAASWHYGAVQNSNGARLVGASASCSSSGDGDVINCFCTDGFAPISLTSSDHAQEAGEIFTDMQMAQVGVDENRKGKLVLILKCKMQPSKKQIAN